jgi:hypothetical protein
MRIDLDSKGEVNGPNQVLTSGHRPKGDALLSSWVRRSGRVQ